MRYTKLISVRLDSETLKEIDKAAVSSRWLKRSDIINRALRNVMFHSEPRAKQMICEEYELGGTIYVKE